MLRWALASACAIVLVICATLVRYEFCFTDSKATDKGASGTGAGGQDANDTRAAAAAPLGGAVHKMRHAVLLAGDRLHALRYTGISLRRYVLDRLGDQDIVDVFLVGTPMSDADAFFVRELLAPRLVYFVMREQMADEVRFLRVSFARPSNVSDAFAPLACSHWLPCSTATTTGHSSGSTSAWVARAGSTTCGGCRRRIDSCKRMRMQRA